MTELAEPSTAATSDGTLKGPHDRTRIDVHRPAELRHWVRELGLPADQIKQAVQAVGPVLVDVRAFLRQRSLHRHR